MSQYQANIDLSSLTGPDGFVLHGLHNGDLLGMSLSMGDINGDGFTDLIVAGGHYNARGGGYVLFGSASGLVAPAGVFDLTSVDGTNGFAFTGGNDYAGRSTAAGDVNGDGIQDLIVGASSFRDPVTHTYRGGAYVVFGHTGGFSATPLDMTALNGSDGFALTGPQVNGATGYSVTTADVNGDHVADMIIGARLADTGANTDTGATYVVFGKQGGGFGTNVDLTGLDGTNGFAVTGVAANDFLGRNVSAGDVNGDGYADLILSAHGVNSYHGAAYVVFGHSGAFAQSIDAGALNGTDGMILSDSTIVGAARGEWAVSSAGDVNGDGITDMMMTARDADGPDGDHTGIVYVVFGHANPQPATFDLSTLNGTNGFMIDGGRDFSYVGKSLAAAGDVNGDGFGDLLLGTPSLTAGQYAGGAYVVFGGPSGFPAVLDLATLDGTNGFKVTAPTGTKDSIGDSTAAGDLNHDGLDDIAIGDVGGPGGSQNGTVFVVYGKLPDAPVNRVGTAASQTLVGGDFSDVLDGQGGNDTLWGHGGDDLLISGSGNDTLYGGDGNDGFAMHGDFNSQDHIDGGPGGNDQIGLEGDYSAGVTLDGNNVTGVEALAMLQGFDYKITTLDNFVGAGQNFTFWSVAMGSTNHVTLDGSAETNGRFTFYLGQGDDSAIGGAGTDVFYGDGGADVLTGNGGSDTFAYLHVDDSTGVVFDKLPDFTVGVDKIKLPSAVTGIDSPVVGGALHTASFDPDMQNAIGAAQLAIGHAVLFSPAGADYGGHTFLIVDANGVAGYQGDLDYVFDVTSGTLAGLSTGDFI